MFGSAVLDQSDLAACAVGRMRRAAGRASADIVAGETLDEEMVARLIAERRYRVAIDDADRAPELALLHLHNACLDCQGSD